MAKVCVIDWIGPVAGVAVGFALAVVWDLAKFRREQGARERAAITGLHEELLANRELASHNATLLAMDEKDYAPENEVMINTLAPLETGAWPLARLNLPRRLAEDTDLVRRLQIIGRMTVEINTLIQSRETFKLQTALAYPRPQGLEAYARILNHQQQDLIQRVEEIALDLVPFTNAYQ